MRYYFLTKEDIELLKSWGETDPQDIAQVDFIVEKLSGKIAR